MCIICVLIVMLIIKAEFTWMNLLKEALHIGHFFSGLYVCVYVLFLFLTRIMNKVSLILYSSFTLFESNLSIIIFNFLHLYCVVNVIDCVKCRTIKFLCNPRKFISLLFIPTALKAL